MIKDSNLMFDGNGNRFPTDSKKREQMKSSKTDLCDLQTVDNHWREYFPICQIVSGATSCEPQTLEAVSTPEAVCAYWEQTAIWKKFRLWSGWALRRPLWPWASEEEAIAHINGWTTWTASIIIIIIMMTLRCREELIDGRPEANGLSQCLEAQAVCLWGLFGDVNDFLQFQFRLEHRRDRKSVV